MKEHNNKINFLVFRKAVDAIFLLFVMAVCAISILFFLNLISVYKIIHTLGIENYALTKVLVSKFATKSIIMYLWGIVLLLFPVWFFFNNKISDGEEKSLVKFLQKQEDTEKLLSYMVSDNWGSVLWAGDLFQQIFKIYKDFSHIKLNFLDILLENKDMEVEPATVNYISQQLKLKQSSFADFPVKIGTQDSAFRLSFTKIGNLYLWQVMLIKQENTVFNNLFAKDVLLNLPLPMIVMNNRGETVATNHLFEQLFNLEKNSSDFYNFIVEKSVAYSYKVNGIENEDVKINRCVFQDSFGHKFEGFLFQSTFFKDKTLGTKYVRSVIVPETKQSLDINLDGLNYQYDSYLEDIYNKAPFGIMVIDAKHKLLKSNENIKSLFNIDYLEDKTVRDLFSSQADVFLEAIKKGVSDLELEIQLGRDRKLLKFIVFDLSQANKIIYVIDITYNRDLEAQLKLSQGLQTVGQIASVVAHDFNNLLTAITGFTHFLQEKSDVNDPSMMELEQIQQNANRAKVMIKQLLTFSRKQELHLEVFNLNSEISDLMSTVVRLIGDSIAAEFHRGKKVDNIMMDRVQFQQVITNLVVNAKDAMKKGGHLDIFTRAITLKTPREGALGTIPAGDYAIVEIKDEGLGIVAENIKLIFKSHFSTKGEKGNGLGLSTVLKIITDSAGFIDVVSVINQGSSFILYFPQTDAKQNVQLPIVEEKPLQDLTGSETILLVEDEIPVRMVCARLLKSKGYNIIEAENGQQALDILNRENIRDIALVISDVSMPVMNGPEVISRVRDIFPNVKAILMSGYADDVLEDIQSDTSMKDIDFLAKPFTPDAFATKVRAIITRK
ncbi:MAG: response regulator [Alphaproteobacteria bacterium]|nr:response regulator [Alphaproteobacteria bacterium]